MSPPIHRPTRTLEFLFLALVCMAVCACKGIQGESAAPAPRAPLTLQVGTSLPRPGVRDTGTRAVIQALISDTLLSVDRFGRILPRLADNWEWLNGGKVLRLTLKPRVRFHDDTELTPDVASAILLDAFARDAQRPGFASVLRIDTTPNDAPPHSLDIHLSRTEGFLPADIAEITMVKAQRIGTGAFRLDSSEATTLSAFESYHLGRPAIQHVELKPYPTLRSAWSAMMRGEINMLYEVSRDAADFVDEESSVRTYSFLRPYYFFVAFNVRHPILGRRDVRQALSQAVDRTAIVRDAMNGRGEPADGPIWKYFWAYNVAERTLAFNREAARLRLDSAGLSIKPGSHPDVMPSRLRFTCLMYGEDPRFEKIALVLQKQLYDVGVDMTIETLPAQELAARMQSGKYDAFLMEMLSGRSMAWPYRTWHSTPPATPTQYFNSGYRAADSVLDRLRHTITEPETRQAVGELQRVLYDDPPALFLAWPKVTRAVNADIEVTEIPDTDIMGRISKFGRAQAAGR